MDVEPNFRDPDKPERDRAERQRAQARRADAWRREGARRYDQSRDRKPLRKRSTRQREIDREVAKVTAELPQFCEARLLLPGVACWGPLDPHHVIPRSVRPDLVTDPSNIVSVCRAHHSYIEDHPEEARRLGLSRESWSVE